MSFTDRNGRPRGRLVLRCAVGAGALAIVFICVNVVLFQANRSAQQAANERQQFINQGAQFSRADEVLVRELAAQAANHHDEAIRDMLAKNGVTYQVNQAPDAAAPAATAAPAASAPSKH